MDQIWWNHIIKAHAFLENVVKEAAGGHSLLLALPDSVPWKSTFLDLIREQLLMENPKNKLEVIECPEEEPGEFILQKYCKRETRAKYRYDPGVPPPSSISAGGTISLIAANSSSGIAQLS